MLAIAECVIEEERHPKQKRVDSKLDAEAAEAPEHDASRLQNFAESQPGFDHFKFSRTSEIIVRVGNKRLRLVITSLNVIVLNFETELLWLTDKSEENRH